MPPRSVLSSTRSTPTAPRAVSIRRIMLAFSAVGNTEAWVTRRRMSRPDSGFATTPTIASPTASPPHGPNSARLARKGEYPPPPAGDHGVPIIRLRAAVVWTGDPPDHPRVRRLRCRASRLAAERDRGGHRRRAPVQRDRDPRHLRRRGRVPEAGQPPGAYSGRHAGRGRDGRAAVTGRDEDQAGGRRAPALARARDRAGPVHLAVQPGAGDARGARSGPHVDRGDWRHGGRR